MAPGYPHFGGATAVPENASGFPAGFGSHVATPLTDRPPPPRAPAPDPLAGGIAAITAHDPDFSLPAFQNDAERTFFIVQSAWMQRKPDLSHQVMAEGLWQQHKMQIEAMIANHETDVMRDLAVASVTPMAAGADPQQDWITIRITAGCADYEVDDRTGKTIAGDRQFQEWAEDWTFNRLPTAKSGKPAALTECPNCGAPLSTDIAGICSYCHQPVLGTDQGWRVARIARLS
jgi:predicted lipid-binding transport protein (Tim44 family)